MKNRDEFKEMELWEHLQELRTRLVRSLAYVALGLVVGGIAYPWVFKVLWAPLQPILDAGLGRIAFRTITEGFTLWLQVSFIAGLVVALPLVTMEVWGFVAPGLTRSERRVCAFVFPLSVLFFFLGVGTGYAILRPSLSWFAQFIPEGTEVLQSPAMYLVFAMKMVVAFGICFQLPMVLMFLSWVGLVTSAQLRATWRYAVVGCFAVAAIATPGGDPFSMCLMAAPLAVLYAASIFLCAFVERMRERQDRTLSGPDRLAPSAASD